MQDTFGLSLVQTEWAVQNFTMHDTPHHHVYFIHDCALPTVYMLWDLPESTVDRAIISPSLDLMARAKVMDRSRIRSRILEGWGRYPASLSKVITRPSHALLSCDPSREPSPASQTLPDFSLPCLYNLQSLNQFQQIAFNNRAIFYTPTLALY